MDRLCVICGSELPGKDPRRMYCSRACNERASMQRYRDARVWRNRACAQCGGSLVGRRTDARFCSPECSGAFRSTVLARARRERKPQCVHCGGPLPLHGKRFCSRACSIKHRRPEKYGLSRDELALLLAQHAVCAICKTEAWGRKGPTVDHDHATRRIRGVLCGNCNQGLGRFLDDPARLRAAATYLETA